METDASVLRNTVTELEKERNCLLQKLQSTENQLSSAEGELELSRVEIDTLKTTLQEAENQKEDNSLRMIQAEKELAIEKVQKDFQNKAVSESHTELSQTKFKVESLEKMMQNKN